MFSSKKSNDVDTDVWSISHARDLLKTRQLMIMELLEEKSSSSACIFALSLHPERNPFQLQYEMYINSPIHDFNGWLTAAHHQKVPIWE